MAALKYPFLLAALALVVAPGRAEPLGEHRDWAAIAFDDSGGARNCMAYTAAREADAAGDAPLLMVTHRPSAGERGLVSIEAEFRDAESTEARIGARTFQLSTAGGAVIVEDAALLAAMRAGSSMRVDTVAGARTFSLLGLTRALGALDAACPAG